VLCNQAVPATNLLLSALPRKDRGQLIAKCESISLDRGGVLYRVGEPITHVYFPTESFISVRAPSDDNANLEVGLIGDEGMLGVTLMLDIDVAPFHALVQGPGFALRLSTSSFNRTLEQSPALQKVLKSYFYVSMSQLAQTSVCARYHVIEARLARWLLMAKDRAHADQFHVTHELIAYMLGVRRVGITNAANSLQHQKLISYRRGDITILDRTGLEAAACKCYRVDNEIYERISKLR
jgi:CRP-like cAMP-binding protein